MRYSYYATGRLRTVTDSEGRVTLYEYDENGNLTRTERPDGSTETCSHDSLNRLTDRVDRDASGNIINGYHYTYDEAGNITSIREDATGHDTVGGITLRDASLLV